jgi:predicted DsbA family dithiol-disulfide isomerase
MKVEIWSDIVCPFCYIGKRRFERALAEFGQKDKIEVIYRSFQLTPEVKTDPEISVVNHLAEKKGISVEKALEMTAYVGEQAALEGLEYNMDNAIVANTFRCHRLLYHALAQGLQLAMKERLLKAYFIEGKNIDDIPTLIALSEEIGVTGAKAILENDSYSDEVKRDILNSKQLGIQGVPFFVFDRKYGVSGAQDSKVFLETIKQSFKEWEEASVQSKE